ncbi:MAG: hypothetical protein EDM74_05355 [Armatimonadetes bacterium]|nr:MAG: hypothetical protein EDM74_05355 [Armatimonadota bacterium]
MATPREVAEWMRAELGKVGELYQDDAVGQLADKFGPEFVYDNQNGNPAISKDVLKEFADLTKADVVWARSGRYWRQRQPDDDPGRQVDY